jgi:hypothetical protein
VLKDDLQSSNLQNENDDIIHFLARSLTQRFGANESAIDSMAQAVGMLIKGELFAL